MLTRTGHARTRTRINTTGSSFSYPNIAGIVSVPSPWGGKRGALSPCSTHNTGRVMFSRPRCPPLMCALSVAAAWRTLLMTIARTSHAYHTHGILGTGDGPFGWITCNSRRYFRLSASQDWLSCIWIFFQIVTNFIINNLYSPNKCQTPEKEKPQT